jgi:hypothetical protein
MDTDVDQERTCEKYFPLRFSSVVIRITLSDRGVFEQGPPLSRHGSVKKFSFGCGGSRFRGSVVKGIGCTAESKVHRRAFA